MAVVSDVLAGLMNCRLIGRNGDGVSITSVFCVMYDTMSAFETSQMLEHACKMGIGYYVAYCVSM